MRGSLSLDGLFSYGIPLQKRWTKAGGFRDLTPEVAEGVDWVIDQLSSSAPREIGPIRDQKPVLIFIDGACEDAGVSVGGVMYDPESGRTECFGLMVPDKVVSTWKASDNQYQVIGQAEFFPAAVARWTWEHRLKNRRAMYFIDNESARLALVKSCSPILPSLRLIMLCLEWDRLNGGTPWYARVPTYSNIADSPSRFEVTEELLSLNAVVVSPIISENYLKSVGVKLGDFRTLEAV